MRARGFRAGGCRHKKNLPFCGFKEEGFSYLEILIGLGLLLLMVTFALRLSFTADELGYESQVELQKIYICQSAMEMLISSVLKAPEYYRAESPDQTSKSTVVSDFQLQPSGGSFFSLAADRSTGSPKWDISASVAWQKAPEAGILEKFSLVTEVRLKENPEDFPYRLEHEVVVRAN